MKDSTPLPTTLVSRMALVGEYRDRLLRLQGAWDLLALLGQMSGIGAEIGETRDSFHRLTGTLLDSLARQLLQQRRHGLRSTAQVAIDILVRNLFERTADVGFLATDAPLRDFVAAANDGTASEAQRQAVQARLAAYVAKYSVYDDIIVLGPDGRVLARLDGSVTLEQSRDPLIAATQRGGVPYVESFGPTDLLGGRRGLLYSAAITGADGRPAGVLCLSFRFEDEMRGIFARLLAEGDGRLFALLDDRGEVLASSDRWQVPPGAVLKAAHPAQALLRFGGREYLREGARSGGYQGYGGPAGWQAQALLPMDFAFRDEEPAAAIPGGGRDDGDAAADHAALARTLDTRDIFDAELRGIPLQAQQIQRELARSVWNGKLARSGGLGAAPQASAFAATFLQEVSRTGMQIRNVFEDAIARLHTGVIGAILDEAAFQASLAIDIMDRNLYERANDCRWWALTPALRDALAEPCEASHRQAGAVLRHINSLYTVYTLLVLFDAQGRVVAVSDPARNALIGQPLDAETVRATLALRDPQHYHVGPHGPSALYGGVPTCVYAAAVRAEGRAEALGGVAIVFDGAPQFDAMLRDALPRGADGAPLAGACGLFVTRSGRVVASTDERFAPGSAAPFAAGLLELPRGADTQKVIEIDGTLYAAGVCQSGGYREYRCDAAPSDDDVAGVLLLRLGQPLAEARAAPQAFEPDRASLPLAGVSPHRPASSSGAHSGARSAAHSSAASTASSAAAPARPVMREIAAFTLGEQWFGLDAAEVDEVLAPLHFIALPNAAPQVPGLLRHRGEVVPVLDLGALLHPGAPALRDGPLLLCRSAQGRRVAMRVDGLGTVFEIDSRLLVPWKSPAGALPVHLLSGRSGASDAMLTLLSTDTLWPALGDAEGRAALAAAAIAAGDPHPLAEPSAGLTATAAPHHKTRDRLPA